MASAAGLLDWYAVQDYSGNRDGFRVLHMLQVETDDEADDASVCAEDDTSVSEGDSASYSDKDFEAVSDGSADVEDDAEHPPPSHGDAERGFNIRLDFWLDLLLVMGFGTQVFGIVGVLFFANRDRKDSKSFHGLQGSAPLGLWLRELCICASILIGAALCTYICRRLLHQYTSAGSRAEDGTHDMSDGFPHLGPSRGPRHLRERMRPLYESAYGHRVTFMGIISILYFGLFFGWAILQSLLCCTAVRAGVYQCSSRYGEADVLSVCGF